VEIDGDYAAYFRTLTGNEPCPYPRRLLEEEARGLCQALELSGPGRDAVMRAGRRHHVGKVHPVFQRTDESRSAAAGIGRRLAESPCSRRHEQRSRFRYELTSALAWLDGHDGEPGADLVAYLVAAGTERPRSAFRSDRCGGRQRGSGSCMGCGERGGKEAAR
jgi:hypothetical protein